MQEKSSENDKKKSSKSDQSELFFFYSVPSTLNLKKKSLKSTNKTYLALFTKTCEAFYFLQMANISVITLYIHLTI